MVFFGLGRKATDHILTDRTVGIDPFDVVDKVELFLTGMQSVHGFEDTIATALHWKVDVITDVLEAGHGFDNVQGHVLWIGG